MKKFLGHLLPKNKRLEQAKKDHSKFIDSVIQFLQESNYSIEEAQHVAMMSDYAARGEKFLPLIQAAQEAVALLSEKDLSPLDKLIAAQIMALLMKNANPQRIVDGATKVSEMYVATGFQQNLFTTDMAIMAQKLQEALNKMGMDTIKVDTEI